VVSGVENSRKLGELSLIRRRYDEFAYEISKGGLLRETADEIEGKPIEYWLRILAPESNEMYRRYMGKSPFSAISVGDNVFPISQTEEIPEELPDLGMAPLDTWIEVTRVHHAFIEREDRIINAVTLHTKEVAKE
jgi:hypothetical protein